MYSSRNDSRHVKGKQQQQQHDREQQEQIFSISRNGIHTIKKVLDERDNDSYHPRLGLSRLRNPSSDCWTNVTEAISSCSDLDDELLFGGDDDEDEDGITTIEGEGGGGEQQRLMVTILSASMTMTSVDDDTLNDDSQSVGTTLALMNGIDPISTTTATHLSSTTLPHAACTSRSDSRKGRVINTKSVSASRSTWCDNATTCAAVAPGSNIHHHQGDDRHEDVIDNVFWGEEKKEDQEEVEGIPSIITLIHDECCYDYKNKNPTSANNNNNNPIGCSDNKEGRDLSEIFHRRPSGGGFTPSAVLLRQVDGVECSPTSPSSSSSSCAGEDVVSDSLQRRLDRAEPLIVLYRAIHQSQDHLIESLEQTLSEVQDSAQDIAFIRDRLSQELDDALDEQDDALNRILTERANMVAAPRVVVLGLSLLYYVWGGTEYLLILAATFCLLEDMLTVCFPCT
jgi:hypothetical protein